jgi:hypothetical protein
MNSSTVSLPLVRELAAEPDPGTKPAVFSRDGRQIATYRSPRLDFRRDVIEQLPADGILVIRIAPTGSQPFSVAMTRAEFENVFSGILQTESWKVGRRYHFPKFPMRARPFLVESGTAPAITPAPRNEKATLSRHVAAPDALEESALYLKQVAAWRDAWRPKRVGVLLVAESHVGEMPGDSQVAVKLPFATPEPLPGQFCRLVYCLGYGEDDVCDPRPVGNRGTPQYWRIFAEIAGLEPPTRITFPFLAGRLAHRLAILRELRKRGIWLVDAATRALYRPGMEGKPRDYVQIIQQSWEVVVWPSVANENPDLICVIGQGVFSAIGHRPELHEALVISQPQDRDNVRHRDGMARLLQAIRSVKAERRPRNLT